jgi:hypothetical protein
MKPFALEDWLKKLSLAPKSKPSRDHVRMLRLRASRHDNSKILI